MVEIETREEDVSVVFDDTLVVVVDGRLYPTSNRFSEKSV